MVVVEKVGMMCSPGAIYTGILVFVKFELLLGDNGYEVVV